MAWLQGTQYNPTHAPTLDLQGLGLAMGAFNNMGNQLGSLGTSLAKQDEDNATRLYLERLNKLTTPEEIQAARASGELFNGINGKVSADILKNSQVYDQQALVNAKSLKERQDTAAADQQGDISRLWKLAEQTGNPAYAQQAIALERKNGITHSQAEILRKNLAPMFANQTARGHLGLARDEFNARETEAAKLQFIDSQAAKYMLDGMNSNEAIYKARIDAEKLNWSPRQAAYAIKNFDSWKTGGMSPKGAFVKDNTNIPVEALLPPEQKNIYGDQLKINNGSNNKTIQQLQELQEAAQNQNPEQPGSVFDTRRKEFTGNVLNPDTPTIPMFENNGQIPQPRPINNSTSITDYVNQDLSGESPVDTSITTNPTLSAIQAILNAAIPTASASVAPPQTPQQTGNPTTVPAPTAAAEALRQQVNNSNNNNNAVTQANEQSNTAAQQINQAVQQGNEQAAKSGQIDGFLEEPVRKKLNKNTKLKNAIATTLENPSDAVITITLDQLAQDKELSPQDKTQIFNALEKATTLRRQLSHGATVSSIKSAFTDTFHGNENALNAALQANVSDLINYETAFANKDVMTEALKKRFVLDDKQASFLVTKKIADLAKKYKSTPERVAAAFMQAGYRDEPGWLARHIPGTDYHQDFTDYDEEDLRRNLDYLTQASERNYRVGPTGGSRQFAAAQHARAERGQEIIKNYNTNLNKFNKVQEELTEAQLKFETEQTADAREKRDAAIKKYNYYQQLLQDSLQQLYLHNGSASPTFNLVKQGLYHKNAVARQKAQQNLDAFFGFIPRPVSVPGGH